jgi:hypothetical protein
MAVDYNAGASSALATQYADLRNAIASRDEARNSRRARDIERQGLFGTGIKQSDIQDFGNLAIKGAALGDARMERKMDRARNSFDRRMKADERRAAILQKRADLGDANALSELKGIHMGMKERRDSFEDYMGKYQEKGLWGTSFGGDDVGYRTEGESKYSQALRGDKPDSVPGFSENHNERRLQEEREPRITGYVPEPLAQSAPGQNEFEDKFGRGPIGAPKQSSYGGSEFEDKHGRGPIGAPKQSSYGGSEFEDKFGKKWGEYDPDLAEQGFLGSNFGKKKADLGNSVTPISEQELRDIASEKDTAHMRAQPSPTAWRSNFYNEKPSDMRMPGVLRNLTQNQRDRMDVLERERVEREDLAPLNEAKAGEAQMIQDIVNKRKRNKIEDFVSNLNIGG